MDKRGKIFNIVGSFFRKENEMPKNGKLVRLEITDEKGEVIQTKQYTSGEKFDFEKINVIAVIKPEENPDKEERFLIDPRFYEVSHYNLSDTKNPIPFDIYTDTYEVKDNEGVRQLIQKFKYIYKSDIPTTEENELQEASCNLTLTIVPQIIKIENIKVILKDSNKKYYRNESFTSADIKQVLGEYSYYREDYGAEGERKTIEIFECKGNSVNQPSTNKRCYVIQNGNNLQPNDQGKATVYIEYRGTRKETSPEDKFVVAIELDVYKEEKIPELIVTFRNDIKRLYYDGENLDIGGDSPELSKIKIEKKYPHQESKLIDLTKELPYYKKGNSNLTMKVGGIVVPPSSFSESSASIPIMDKYGIYTDGFNNGYFKIEFEYIEIDNSGNRYKITWSSIDENNIKNSKFLAQVYKVSGLEISYNEGFLIDSKLNISINQRITDAIKQVKVLYSHNIVGKSEKILNSNDYQIIMNQEKPQKEKDLFQESQIGNWMGVVKGSFSEGLFKIKYDIIESTNKEDSYDKALPQGEVTIITHFIQLKDCFTKQKENYTFSSNEFHINSKTGQEGNELGYPVFKRNPNNVQARGQFDLFVPTDPTRFKDGIDRIEIYDADAGTDELTTPLYIMNRNNANINYALDRGHYFIKVYLINEEGKMRYIWMKNKNEQWDTPNVYTTEVTIVQICTTFKQIPREGASEKNDAIEEDSRFTDEQPLFKTISLSSSYTISLNSNSDISNFDQIFYINSNSKITYTINNQRLEITFKDSKRLHEGEEQPYSENAEISINKDIFGIEKGDYFFFPDKIIKYIIKFEGKFRYDVTITKPEAVAQDFWKNSYGNLPLAIDSVRKGTKEEKDKFKTHTGEFLNIENVPCYLMGYDNSNLYFMYPSNYDTTLKQLMNTSINSAKNGLIFQTTDADKAVISTGLPLSIPRKLVYKDFSAKPPVTHRHQAALQVWVPTAEELGLSINNIISSGESKIPNYTEISNFSDHWLSNCSNDPYSCGSYIYCLLAKRSGSNVERAWVYCSNKILNLTGKSLLVKCFKVSI